MTSFHQFWESRDRQFDGLPVSARVRSVFAHFQNLNLLALINDLRSGRVARAAWLDNHRLCPVAHGMATGEIVKVLAAQGHSEAGHGGCGFAARHLGADRRAVVSFVREWDDQDMSPKFLLAQLESLWKERLEDAIVTQEIIHETRMDDLTTDVTVTW